jgi:hypothetical protein
MQTAPARGYRIDGAAAHTELHRDLALREGAFSQQVINFFDDISLNHSCVGEVNGDWINAPSFGSSIVVEPEVAVVGQRISLVVIRDEHFPARIVLVIKLKYIEVTGIVSLLLRSVIRPLFKRFFRSLFVLAWRR